MFCIFVQSDKSLKIFSQFVDPPYPLILTRSDRSNYPADKFNLKMPPKYQFENVVCYIFLQTLLTNEGVYANSVHADKKYPNSLICFYTVKQSLALGFSNISVSNKKAALKSLPALSFNALIIPILRIVCTIPFHYSCPCIFFIS